MEAFPDLYKGGPIAVNVLRERYLKKNEEGALVEAPKDMFERVARFIGGADAKYGEDPTKIIQVFYNLMATGDFEPNTPCLANAGWPGSTGQFSACFAAGTMITTKRGFVPIENVVVGDEVLTHKGRYRCVTRTMIRKSQRVYRVKIDKLPPLLVTDEHPFLTQDGWVKMCDLIAKEHFVQIGARPLGTETVVEHLPSKNGGVGRPPTPLPSQITIDADVAWFLGIYVAQGSTSDSGDVRFTLGQHRAEQAARVAAVVMEKFGLEARIEYTEREDTGHRWMTARIGSVLLAQWLDGVVGRGFDEKYVPFWLMDTTADVRTAFLQGVADGDGTPINGTQTRITLSNEVLVRQLFDVAFSLGYWPTLNKSYMPSGATAQPWSVAYGEEFNVGMVRRGCYRVSKIEDTKLDVDVYNFEVEEDHTYVANQMIVHNCFVLPVPDSMEGVFETLKNMALIHRSGGGTGFGFSELRPDGDFVRSTTGIASGPVSFMAGYNNTTEVVKQSGIRRGANMGILRVDHPDILQFIHCKRKACEVCAELGRKNCDHNIRNFNISVALTDAFMAALDADAEYDLINPRTKLATGKLRARDVWKQIVENAWFSGEPGAFFVDRVNQLDPLSAALGPIQATNPCGEVPLRAYDACTLGSINLGRFYVEKAGKGTIDFERLRQVTQHGTHFLDNVLTVNTYPIPQIGDVTSKCRKVGLGVMGWADLLIKLGIPYASDKALSLAEEVMQFINRSAVEMSEELAAKRGPFHYWKDSSWAKNGDKPRRNSTVTVIAPTGSISIIAGCNFGIEPLSAISMVRNQAGMKQHDFNQEFVNVAKREGWHSDAIMEQVTKTGSCRGVDGVPERVQELFAIAPEIACEWHVKMQAAFQKHVEDAVSKTINLAKSATVTEVEDAYMLAWKLGCKGITVYRDGSRSKQVISAGAGGQEVKTVRRNLKSIDKVKGVRRRRGETLSVDTPYGAVHVTINTHPGDGEPFECFVELGKSGTETKALTESLGRIASLHLSDASGDSPRKILEMIAEQLTGIGGGSQSGFGDDKVISAPDGLAKAIFYYLNQNDGEEHHAEAASRLDLCPKCNQATLTKGVGCDLCETCGYSSC